jgi:hypothetical protein
MSGARAVPACQSLRHAQALAASSFLFMAIAVFTIYSGGAF